MKPLEIFCFQTSYGDFILAVGHDVASAREAAISSCDISQQAIDEGLEKLIHIEDMSAIDVLMEQYGGACFLSSESGS